VSGSDDQDALTHREHVDRSRRSFALHAATFFSSIRLSAFLDLLRNAPAQHRKPTALSHSGENRMSELYDKGLRIRREVLGNETVDRSLAAVNSFNGPMNQLTTEWCWGEIWGRPGLDHKTRSIINLAMLTALNRPNELEEHVRGAIHNGVTASQIQEILLQTAIYCGVPAAIDSFTVATKTLKEMKIM